jgi:hypothetical protein
VVELEPNKPQAWSSISSTTKKRRRMRRKRRKKSKGEGKARKG